MFDEQCFMAWQNCVTLYVTAKFICLTIWQQPKSLLTKQNLLIDALKTSKTLAEDV